MGESYQTSRFYTAWVICGRSVDYQVQYVGMENQVFPYRLESIVSSYQHLTTPATPASKPTWPLSQAN